MKGGSANTVALKLVLPSFTTIKQLESATRDYTLQFHGKLARQNFQEIKAGDKGGQEPEQQHEKSHQKLVKTPQRVVRRSNGDSNQQRCTVCLWNEGIPQKVFPTFYNISYALMQDRKNMQESKISIWVFGAKVHIL